MTTDERLKKLLDASPEQRGAIDRILEGHREKLRESAGPLLMGMSVSAKFLGVSRATLWRMVRAGLLQKVELLPGSFRLRRADLETIAAGRKLCPSDVDRDQHEPRWRPYTNAWQDKVLAATNFI